MRQLVTTLQALEIGLEHQRAGRLPEAERVYLQVLEVDPGNAEAWHLLGLIGLQVGRHQIAAELIGKALAIQPNNVEALNNRGNALQGLGRYDEAIASYDKALALQPDNAETLYNRGLALQGLTRYEEALACYDKVLAIKPDYVDALNNRANALQKVNRYEEALANYDRALAIKPDSAEILSNRGLALRGLKRYDEALASHDRALAIKPDFAEAFRNRGDALETLNRHEEALESWRSALALKPDLIDARSRWVHGRQRVCDWSGLQEEFEALRAEVIQRQSGKVSPFHFFVLPGTHAREHLLCARQFAEHEFGGFLSRSPLCEGYQRREDGRKLRIGYLSADFRQHAVSNLVVEVIELHDRSRFEVLGYSYGPDDASAMRRRLQAAFDTFTDIVQMPDALAARRILEDGVDILVDLTGYTENCRLQIMALRPAPVQVTWFGYPGTLGHARLADYLIGDAIVSPLTHGEHFSEALALMPNCLQPNDRKRAIGEKPTREAAGLPPEGFVFCCFNQSYKITPEVFDIWCRLLTALPKSVLWLVSDSRTMQRNLQREARQRGVDPERLIFAPWTSYADHLARFQLAGIFLDTLPANAGATASDALWAGVPLVTCIGETYFGRYAASLLDAAGLPELITRSMRDYETLALQLSTNPDRLAQVRAKLAAARLNCALFDSVRFTRDLERLFQRMWADHLAGTKRHIVIAKTEDRETNDFHPRGIQ